MDYSKVLTLATQQAAKAKPGMVKIDGDVYTLVFDQTQWHYQVFKNAVWYVNFNTKSLATAKKYLREWIAN